MTGKIIVAVVFMTWSGISAGAFSLVYPLIITPLLVGSFALNFFIMYLLERKR